MVKTLISMDETGLKMSFSEGDDISVTYPIGFHISNGHWHYVALTLEVDEVTLYIDGITDHSSSFTPVEPF